MVMRDQANPRVVGMGGTAFAGSVTGTVSVEPTFADFGGGVRQVALLVDGAEYRRTAPKCAEPYTSAVPCPMDGTEPFELDTRALTNGPHTLSVELHDVAGNRSESKGYAVLVDNVAAVDRPSTADRAGPADDHVELQGQGRSPGDATGRRRQPSCRA